MSTKVLQKTQMTNMYFVTRNNYSQSWYDMNEEGPEGTAFALHCYNGHY